MIAIVLPNASPAATPMAMGPSTASNIYGSSRLSWGAVDVYACAISLYQRCFLGAGSFLAMMGASLVGARSAYGRALLPDAMAGQQAGTRPLGGQSFSRRGAQAQGGSDGPCSSLPDP